MFAIKLRLQSLTTRQAFNVQVPFDFTFKQLEDLLCQRFPSPSNPSSTTVRGFYLDRKSSNHKFNPEDTLLYLGITQNGPLYCTIGSSSSNMGIQGHDTIDTIVITIVVHDSKENLYSSSVREIKDGETLDSNIVFFGAEAKECDQTKLLDILESGSRFVMDMDIDGSISGRGKDFSVAFFLRRIFREEIGDSEVRGHRLIALAVHAVLIKSGFVYFDPVSNMKIERFHLPKELFSSSQSLSLCYTLPEIIDENMETVVLKFQCFGKYLTIYGSLTKNGYGPYWARVDKNRVSLILNLVWADLDLLNRTVQREVFEFWKTIKDNLALPLLIDLCERAGLPSPPCFTMLPSDIKLQILKSLSGKDIARAACVCSELHYLSSNEDLWKEKYEEEFGSGTTTSGKWKEKYGKSWEAKNRMSSVRFPMHRRRGFQDWPSRRHVVAEPRSGSGSDWFSRRNVVAEPRSGSGSHLTFYQSRGIFLPYCNLGGPSL